MPGCEICQNLNSTYSIKTPGEFRKTITVVHEYLRTKRLIEIEDASNRKVLGVPPFREVCCDGPWNDFFSHYFQCTHCSKHFLLHVETYNGSGGKWEPFSSF